MKKWARLCFLACVGVVGLCLLEAEGAESYTLVAKWGTYGTGDGQFRYQQGIAVGPCGNIFVPDYINHRVQVFDPWGTFLFKWGEQGSDPGQFHRPGDVAFSLSGDIMVLERGGCRIQVFDSLGNFKSIWGYGTIHFPAELAVDFAGDIYVADTGHHRVLKLDSSGSFLATWGSEGSGDGQFRSLNGIAAGPDGNIFVADTVNHRIQKFDPFGNFLAKWGSYGSGDGEFKEPCSIHVDAGGNIFVADSGNHRIQKLSGDGTLLAKWGSYGSGDGEMEYPMGIAMDSEGYVYVSDSENHRVQKFAPANRAPQADAAGPYIAPGTSWAGASVTLDGSMSFDPDGDPLDYTWRIGTQAIGTTAQVEYQFPIGLTEDVSLTVQDPSNASDTATTSVTVTVIDVGIDIKPGSYPNSINLGSKGVVPVAFLTDEGFDAATIDAKTVTMAGLDFFGLVRMRGRGGENPVAGLQDVDGDGDLDLVVQLETERLTLQETDTICTLGALTSDGLVIQGEDSVRIVPEVVPDVPGE